MTDQPTPSGCMTCIILVLGSVLLVAATVFSLVRLIRLAWEF